MSAALVRGSLFEPRLSAGTPPPPLPTVQAEGLAVTGDTPAPAPHHAGGVIAVTRENFCSVGSCKLLRVLVGTAGS